MDVIAYAGMLRQERHEKVARWALRVQMAEFELANVSNNICMCGIEAQMQAVGPLLGVDVRVTQRVDKGSILLYSHKVPIFSVSAWQSVQKTGC